LIWRKPLSIWRRPAYTPRSDESDHAQTLVAAALSPLPRGLSAR
jgi:hypothetical protein